MIIDRRFAEGQTSVFAEGKECDCVAGRVAFRTDKERAGKQPDEGQH
jgi:hypothetical protein